MNLIYTYESYKEYVKDSLHAQGHGSRLKLASALNCQSAYISQVLNQDAHLSLEQAADASVYFNLNQNEEDFFLLLVQKAKAGSKKLKDIHLRKIKKIREERALFSNRINDNDELDDVTQSRYYSRWYYAAIHIIVTIPAYTDKESISDYLGLKMEVVNEAIQFLESTGLIVLTSKGFTTGKTKVFLKGDSPFIVQHHQNWRLRAVDMFVKKHKDNLHFSSVYSLSKSDFVAIKEKLFAHIQEVRDIVRPSKEEELCVLNLDFFKLLD
jgi:uncharacterized protein (TIGR02147 family)